MKIFRLEKGDLVVEKLTQYLQDEKGGFLTGIGALAWANLMFYDLDKKKFHKKRITGPLEIGSFSAVVAKLPDGKIALHPHAVLSSTDFECFGGHLEEAEVLATFEAVFFKSDKIVSRQFSKEIDLNLLKDKF